MNVFGKLLLFFVGSIFVAIGSYMTYYTWISGSWPTAPGLVMSSKVSWAGGSDGHQSARALVSYEYNVNGHHYTGNTVSYDDYGSGFSSHAQSIVDEYPEGKNIPIHYEPGSPQFSVIRGGSVGFFPLVFLGAGLLMASIAILSLLWDLFVLVFALFVPR